MRNSNDRAPWDDAWVAISDGVDEPAAYLSACLSRANHDLASLIEQLDGRLKPEERERLYGQSKLLAAVELAITGAEVGGSDTHLALDVRPRRENRVRWRDRIPLLNMALSEATKLENAGLSRDKSAKIAARKLGVSRTQLRDWDKLWAEFSEKFDLSSPEIED